MSASFSLAVVLLPAPDAVARARREQVLARQLAQADRVVSPADEQAVESLSVDLVAVLGAGVLPGPGWVACLQSRLRDPRVGAVTGPVLRFTEGRSTNVLVPNKFGGALNGAGAWSELPPLTPTVDSVCCLPVEQYAVRADLVRSMPIAELATVRGRSEILAACARSRLAVMRDSGLQVETHTARTSVAEVRERLAYDEGYQHMRVADTRDALRWALLGSRRSPGLLPAFPVVLTGGARRRIGKAAIAGRIAAITD